MPILFTLGLEHALVVPFHGSEFVKWSFNPSLHRVIKKKDLSDPGTMNHFTPDFPSVSNTCLSHVALPLCICKTAHLRPITCSSYQRVLTAAPRFAWRGTKGCVFRWSGRRVVGILSTWPDAEEKNDSNTAGLWTVTVISLKTQLIWLGYWTENHQTESACPQHRGWMSDWMELFLCWNLAPISVW